MASTKRQTRKTIRVPDHHESHDERKAGPPE